MSKKTRTVGMTPIGKEVENYLEYLKENRMRVVRIVHSSLPGHDTMITFVIKDEGK